MKLNGLFKAMVMSVLLMTMASNASLATEVSSTTNDEVLLQKQQEIDTYVFDEHVKDIEAKGFIVTTTAQVGDSIEISIQPYSEENANYLYELFGHENVTVAEGLPVGTLVAPDDSLIATTEVSTQEEVLSEDKVIDDVQDEELMQTTSIEANQSVEKNDTLRNTMIAAIAGVVLLGSAVLLKRKGKTTNK